MKKVVSLKKRTFLDMKKFLSIILFVQISVCSISVIYAQPSSRAAWNDGWTFTKDGQSKVLNLPHDWGVEGPFIQEYEGSTGKLAWWGKAEYSKTLEVTASDIQRRKCFFLDIDGAMSFAKVFCNGQFVMEWPYGYASFQANLTPFLHEGANEVKVTLDNLPKSSRWYPGGGIYRNVWLEKTDPVGIDRWGVKITTSDESPADGSATMSISTAIRNDTGEKIGTAKVSTAIFDGDRLLVSDETTTEGESTMQNIHLKGIKFWNLQDCNLLKVRSIVSYNEYADTLFTLYGVRTAEFRPDGFYLNGVRTPLNGVCLHHDAGALGAVWNNSVWIRRLQQLKDMGCNAIRTSHNPPAPELLDLCDRMGFVVMDELTDTWITPKRENGYGLLFSDWAEKDLKAMILRDRNHPSVVLWSIGNEVSEQAERDGYFLAKYLSGICHDEDPTRLTTSGCNITKSYLSDFRKGIDVFGFNYKPHLYGKFHELFPSQPYLGSETASCISSRGVYLFPPSDKKQFTENNFQVCSYDLYTVPWGHTPEGEWKGQDENPSCAGEFVWTGFDYLGEPTPYNSDMTELNNFHDSASIAKARKELAEKGKIATPSRSSYFGIIDLAGFPKDRYWIYQARWTDKPVLHILPHWNWSGAASTENRIGQITPVHVYTNMDEVELFVNGKSQGKLTREKNQYRLRWDNVIYEPGNVVAKGYKDGKSYSETIVTSGPAAKLDVSYEYGAERDLVFVTVKVIDRHGNFVPTANNLLKFSVSGNGQLVATDAGDATSLVPFYSDEIDAFNGLCSAIIRTTYNGSHSASKAGSTCKISLTVSSPGLKTAKVSIK